jgi:hypothetical protein
MTDPFQPGSVDEEEARSGPRDELAETSEYAPEEAPASVEPSPASTTTGGEEKGKLADPPPADPPPADPIADAEKKLREAQRALDAAKKQKSEDGDLGKAQDAIKKQRATSSVAIDQAEGASEEWQETIETQFNDPDGKQLKEQIGAVVKAVSDAQTSVATFKVKVIEAESDQKQKDAKLAAAQKKYDAKKAELQQLHTRMKETQSQVEKLADVVKGAMASGNWRRAFGKNHQLSLEIASALKLVAPGDDGEEKKLIKELDGLRGELITAQTAADGAKEQFTADQASLKTAEDDLKLKKAEQEAKIDSILARRWPNGDAALAPAPPADTGRDTRL